MQLAEVRSLALKLHPLTRGIRQRIFESVAFGWSRPTPQPGIVTEDSGNVPLYTDVLRGGISMQRPIDTESQLTYGNLIWDE